MAKRKPSEGMAFVTATATCSASWGQVRPFRTAVPATVSRKSDRFLPATVVAERIGWLSALVREMTQTVLTEHWNPADLAALADGVGLDGKKLPSNGWMAMRRLGWVSVAPDGVYVSDRIRRIAEEHAARLLRLGLYRDKILDAVVATWPDIRPERTRDDWTALWNALREAGLGGVTKVEARNRTRQVAAYQKANDRLPASITLAEDAPFVSGQILLAAADDHQVILANDTENPRTLLLHLQLPTIARPTSTKDWEWVTLPIRLPEHVDTEAEFLTPTLRLVNGRVRVDLPWTRTAPRVTPDGHVRAIGFDWGVNTLLSGAVGKLGQDRRGRLRVVSTGKPYAYNADGVADKLTRMYRELDQINTRMARQGVLLAGRSDADTQRKHDVLAVEHERLHAKIRNIGKALAWSAARWAVDHAVAAGASVIYVEDLATMESGRHGKKNNRRLSRQVRGLVFDAMRHLATIEGIALVEVPARGTSSCCPRCGRGTSEWVKEHGGRRGLRHVKASNNLKSGHKWARCRCGLSCDRDWAAAERILARGLLSQAHARRTRDGDIKTLKAVDGPVRRLPGKSRDKNRPTPTQTSPLRRTIPTMSASAGIPAPAGQRPVGRTPQEPTAVAVRGQVPLETKAPNTSKGRRDLAGSTRRHRPRGARLGRGFHLHVHATPVSRRRPVPRLSVS